MSQPVAIFASYASAFGGPPFEFSRKDLTAGADPVKFGIRHWDGFTLNMMIRDEQRKVAKIGETFFMGLLAAGDLLVELGGVKLDGSLELSAVATLGIQGKPADLLVSRDGKPLKLKIQLERAR